MTRWAILTGEYPPQLGGVADYTRLVARGLVAAGDAVTVYAPRCPDPTPDDGGVHVCRLPDHFGPRGLLWLEQALAKSRPDRILIQYVPHAFGYKAMNVPFAVWVATRAPRVAPVWVMFHEVRFPFAWRPTNAILASTHVVMGRLVGGAAKRVFVSVPGWERLLRSICPRLKPAEWLPIPSNVPISEVERPVCTSGTKIGHFGTYGSAVVPLLEPALVSLLNANAERVVTLLGRGGTEFALGFDQRHPTLAARVTATGDLTPDAISDRLRECDLLVQPFIDGISTRRTSAMAGIANGVPVVSNLGEWSEPMWSGVECVGIAPKPDTHAITFAAEAVLALSGERRNEMGRAAALLYRQRFSLDNTIRTLRTPRPKMPR